MEIIKIKRRIPLEQIKLNYAKGDRLSQWKEATLSHWRQTYKTPDGKAPDAVEIVLLTPDERKSVTSDLVPIADYVVKQLGQQERSITAFYAPGGVSFSGWGGYRPGAGRDSLTPESRLTKIQFRVSSAIVQAVSKMAESGQSGDNGVEGVTKSDVCFDILQEGYLHAIAHPELLESPPEAQIDSQSLSLRVEPDFALDLLTYGNPGDKLSKSATYTRLFLIGFELKTQQKQT